jgi:hypothetical protein
MLSRTASHFKIECDGMELGHPRHMIGRRIVYVSDILR